MFDEARLNENVAFLVTLTCCYTANQSSAGKEDFFAWLEKYNKDTIELQRLVDDSN